MSSFEIVPNTSTTQISDRQATFVIEPLAAGFGHTIGNALRRVLLSQLTGAAVTRIRIDGVSHEFSTIPGVTEDVVQLLLAIKKVRFHVDSTEPQTVSLDATGVANITAGDLQVPGSVEISNPDMPLVTLTDASSRLSLELTVESGRGYQAAPQENLPIGVIGLDAKFSPVTRVNYSVESTRVGQATDLDKLIIEITTDGSLSPEVALGQASSILVEAFSAVDGRGFTENDTTQVGAKKSADGITESTNLDEIGISTRVLNSLKRAGIETVGDLRSKDREELLAIKNLGEKSLDEVLEKVG
jgi:DNA-directed RNA polymerase subunit alpha